MICGTGPLQDQLKALAQALGVAQHVTFTGLVDNALVAQYCAAADLFVLPSLLEACPTVAVEALASGTPVVSADHPGGVELHALFGDDVAVVPREQPDALARADHREARAQGARPRAKRPTSSRASSAPRSSGSGSARPTGKALDDRGRKAAIP